MRAKWQCGAQSKICASMIEAARARAVNGLRGKMKLGAKLSRDTMNER